MFVEDLILRLGCADKYLFEPEIIDTGSTWEKTFSQSVASQLQSGNTLTEKQAAMAVKIVKKYQASLEVYFRQKLDLTNPVFKKSFRKISNEKTIKIENINGEKKIVVRFAYDEKLIKSIQHYISNTPWKSLMYANSLKAHIGEWNVDIKAWVFGLREDTILWLETNLVNTGFETDSDFKEFVTEINHAVDNMLDYVPHVSKQDNEYTLRNASKNISIKNSNNLIEYLISAKNQGITAWDNAISSDLNNIKLDPITNTIINSVDPIFIDSTIYNVDQFENLIKFGGPILIIVPGGSEIQHTRLWHETALKWGIDSADMAVLFRMPNESHGSFNAYIKEHNLNNNIHPDIKIVFASIKIPKPLVKSELKFNTVINLGYYRDLHYSMSVLLHSTPNIVYYNNKHPHGVNVCPQQN
jgi:hypothetical protein